MVVYASRSTRRGVGGCTGTSTSAGRFRAEIAQRPAAGLPSKGVVREVLVVGLQEAVPATAHLGAGREGVGAEQHLLAVRADQPRRGAWLAAELGHPLRHVDDHVRISREHAIDPGQVLGVAADVRDDERRARMRGDERLERLDQALEARDVAAVIRPLGRFEQLLEPLVRAVDGLEEGHGIGRVDEHRQAQLARGREHGRQPLVVGQHVGPVRVADAEPEVLQIFSPRAPGGV